MIKFIVVALAILALIIPAPASAYDNYNQDPGSGGIWYIWTPQTCYNGAFQGYVYYPAYDPDGKYYAWGWPTRCII